MGTTVIGSGARWGATVDDSGQYLLDEANGATLLTIPSATPSTVSATLAAKIEAVTAATATRRRTVTHVVRGHQIPMTAGDQVAVTGRLESGAVLSLYYRGGHSAGTNFRWEIHGTAGDIVVGGASGHLQYRFVEVGVARGDRTLEPSPPPAAYAPAEVDPRSPAFAVAAAYAALAEDLRDGGHRVPTFADAVARHRTLDAVRAAASI